MKWLRNLIKKSIREELEKERIYLYHKFDEVNCQLTEIKQLELLQDFNNFSDKIDKVCENISRINQMTLELKGVKSMARAAVAERNSIKRSTQTTTESIDEN